MSVLRKCFFQFKYSSQSVGAIFFWVSHGLHLTPTNKTGWCLIQTDACIYNTACEESEFPWKGSYFSRFYASSEIVDNQNASVECDWKTVRSVGRTWGKDEEFTLRHPALLCIVAHWKCRFIHISGQRDEPHPQIHRFAVTVFITEQNAM